MGLGKNLREPTGIAAAILLGAAAAAVTAARADSAWLALPVGLGVGLLVLVVYALLVGTPPAPASPWPANRAKELPKSAAEARELLRRTCLAAVEVRVHATTVRDADAVMAPTTRVIDAAYRLAALVVRHDGRMAKANVTTALTALGIGAARMEDVAARIDGAAATRVAVLIEDLGLVKRDLESAESTVAAALQHK